MPYRSEIRSSDGTVQEGIPLHLIIHVFDVDNGSCIPLKDIRHANPQGIYSAVNDVGTMGKKFLQGYQITDNNGTGSLQFIQDGIRAEAFTYTTRFVHLMD